MRLLGIGFSCLLLALISSPLLAQSETKNAQASIVFDLRVEKITDSPLGKALDLKGKMEAIPRAEDDDGPDMSKLVRVFGASTGPESVEELESMQQGDLPVEFFVRFQFKDADGAKSMLKAAVDKNDGTVERDGKTYYKAPASQGVPEGVMMYAVDDKTVEVGTEGFVFRSNAKPFTDTLNQAWSKVSDDAVRFAVDMDTNKELVEDMISKAEEQAGGNPMASEMLSVFKKMKSMSLTMDLKNKNLVTMTSTGKTESDASEIKDAMSAMMFKAKQGGKAQAKQIAQMSPDAAKAMTGLVDGMSVTMKGDNVFYNVPRPEGFEDAVSKMVEQFGGMFGMGGMSNDF
ncbi:MAG: hypothetical protein AAFN77_14570 [Planctomycetota bacterium]